MKIDILCNDGSPLGVTSKTIWGDNHRIGVGGAELALLTMCEEWYKVGYDVVLYNNPWEQNASLFEQRNINQFDVNGKRDVLITFRSPNPKAVAAKGYKVWWSCDPYTVSDYRHFSTFMDKIVCISKFHAEYFKNIYGINSTIVIDVPVRVNDYEGMNFEKVKNRIIFSSVPDRGLQYLNKYWDTIKNKIPDVSLVITSDYRLWGAGALNEKHRLSWLSKENIEFLGAVNRQRLLEEELKADLFVYPCVYDEFFCISCAEAQFAGAYPITSGRGALQTTNMGRVLLANPEDVRNAGLWINSVVEILSDRNALQSLQKQVQKKAINRFHPDKILLRWDKEVFNEN